MKENVPTLLSMKDMIVNGLDLGIQEHVVTYNGRQQNLFFENYFLIHRWQPTDIDYCLYSTTELRRLHRVFGHPSVNALANLLKRANPEEFTSDVRKTLQNISEKCDICIKHSSKPRRFKLTVGTGDLRFNHTVAVDVMYLSGKAVLHMVDEATHYSAAQFLKKQSTTEVWKAIRRCWLRVYLGPPDFLHVDQGSNLVSKEFMEEAEVEGIRIIEAPVESPSTMSHVERYHAPLKLAYSKIRTSLGNNESDMDCLQLAVKAVNDTVGPEGLCPTLLVYGTLPRPARKIPSHTQLQRAKAKDEATKQILKEHAKRKIAFGLKHCRGPKGKEQSSELYKLPAGSPVYVYREVSKSWEGPFPFINIDGETVVVQLPHGRRIFRSSVIKPANGSVLEDVAFYLNNESINNEINLSDLVLSAQVSRALFGTTKVRTATKSEAHLFKEARRTELEGLLERQIFRVLKKQDIPKHVRVYGSRFVDVFKTVDDSTSLKSRLVAQNYKDFGAAKISTKSPTISRAAQRLAVALAAYYVKQHPEHKPYLRDITQAYTQALSQLERMVLLKPPAEMGLNNGEVLLVVKPCLLYTSPSPRDA